MSNESTGWRAWGILLAAVCTFAPATVFAQPGSTGVGEVAGFGGGSFGIGSQPVVGGSSGVAFSRYGMALIEASYQPLGHRTLQGWPDASAVRGSYLWDFNFSLHIRVPVKNRWEPYGIAGAGFLWNHVNRNATGPDGNAVVYHLDQFNGSFHTGGGLRYYIGENWGIRPEVKVIVSRQTYVRLSFGVFYTVYDAF